ncbi:MAG: hypothetical protein M5R41_03065 [Bacteroidia bacterium]|nr:hypothetical protein [Bacteroidia bacterium]
MKRLALAGAMLICALCGHVAAQTTADTPNNVPKTVTAKSPVQVGGQFFISYEDGRVSGVPYSNFFINRAYINIRAEVLPWLNGRVTPDIAVDRDGDGEGDLELRLKYCYVTASLPDLSFLQAPYLEFGLIGRPWLEFEQKINLYRVQGPMFLERGDVLNSADFGAQLGALLGGEMPEEYQKTVSSSYPGRYGSVALGLFNGGGYHAIEHNLNKSIEGRISVRPLPDIIPGMQLTYAGAYGKGNVERSVDWKKNVGHLSFEHQRLVVALTYFTGTGDYKGKTVNADGIAEKNSGWSAFTDIRIPETPLSVFGRYDHFALPDSPSEWEENTIIVGATWHIHKKSKLLVDFEKVLDKNGDGLTEILKLSVEYGF